MLRTLLRRSLLSAGLLFLSALHASAQTTLVTEIAAFTDPAEGVNGFPSEFTEGPDGMIYGVADRSNTRFGSIFRINPNTNARSIVAQVDYGPGAGMFNTSARMVLANDGKLYGTFFVGNTSESAIFRFDPATNLTTVLHSFAFDPITSMPGPDGLNVQRLALGADGWLYGATTYGNDSNMDGTIFKFDPITATFVTLARPSLADGFYAYGPLVEAAPGVWLGNYYSGEPSGACSRVFRFDANTNAFQHLAYFFLDVEGCSANYLSLARAGDGTVYGTAETGGAPAPEDDYTHGGRGAFFKLDPNTGAYTQLHHFAFDDAVQGPHADLTVGDDGLLYAGYMTPVGSDFDKGLVRVDPATGVATRLAQLPLTPGFLGESGFFMGSDGRWFGGTSSPWMAYAIGILDGVQVTPASAPFGGSASLSATLKTVGVPVAGAVIDFTLNGNPVGSATTGTNGVATLNGVSVSGIAIGTYAGAVGASFAGDVHFPSASGSGDLEVTVPPPPTNTATPGLMLGLGYIKDNDTRYDFAFLVSERANGADRGGLDLRVSSPATYKTQGRKKVLVKAARNDRFVARTFTNVVFSDDPTSRPGWSHRPQVDTVLFAGTGSWNGHSGYRFEAFAQDRGEPGRHRESLRVTVYDAANHVVVTFDDVLDGGNVQSLRLHH